VDQQQFLEKYRLLNPFLINDEPVAGALWIASAGH
jgi:hypothetical protein